MLVWECGLGEREEVGLGGWFGRLVWGWFWEEEEEEEGEGTG